MLLATIYYFINNKKIISYASMLINKDFQDLYAKICNYLLLLPKASKTPKRYTIGF